MTNIGGSNAVCGKQGGLEREDTQHMISTATNFFKSLRAPGPNRRRHKVHRLDAMRLQIGLQIQIEIRRIDTDENIRALLQEARFELAANAHNLPVTVQHLPAIAMH